MSAFCVPCRSSIGDTLCGWDATVSLKHEANCGNVIRKLTLGIKQTYSEISASKAFGGNTASRSMVTNAQGQLVVTKSFPLLSKRYKLMDLIGQGTFSQIYKATDCYSGKSVAIKIMSRGYEVLGMRERMFIQHFTMRCRRGSNPCRLFHCEVVILVYFIYSYRADGVIYI